jgi:hypothetical protein
MPNDQPNQKFLGRSDWNTADELRSRDFHIQKEISTWRFVVRYDDGSLYEGGYQNFWRQGDGEQKWQDGNVYHGNFSEDTPCGKGNYIFSNGDHYSGDFSEGKFNGYGNYQGVDGKSSGNWKNNQKHGKIKETFENGEVFEGNFWNIFIFYFEGNEGDPVFEPRPTPSDK